MSLSIVLEKLKTTAGVALAIWRRSLRAEDLRAGKNERTATERDRSWWAAPPEEAERELPNESDDLDRFVLHASLLHGGLERELLTEGLPFPRDEVAQRLDRLISARILLEGITGLVVSEAAYIPVRRSLATHRDRRTLGHSLPTEGLSPGREVSVPNRNRPDLARQRVPKPQWGSTDRRAARL